MTRARSSPVAALLVLAVSGAFPLAAQRPGSVRGVVLDAVTGAPLAQVIVAIVDRELTATTDPEGNYLIRGIAPGVVRLTAQKVGFHPITTSDYSIRSDSVVVSDFRLAPLAVNLPPLDVRGERTEGRAAIGAKILTPADLPSRGNVLTALQGVVAGLQTSGRRDDVRVRMRQSYAEALYVIDGTVVTPPLRFYIDTQDVACVEIRRGYRAAQEYRQSINSQPYSGVILIWTRGSVSPMPRECGQSDA